MLVFTPAASVPLAKADLISVPRGVLSNTARVSETVFSVFHNRIGRIEQGLLLTYLGERLRNNDSPAAAKEDGRAIEKFRREIEDPDSPREAARVVVRSFIVERDAAEYFSAVRSENSKGEAIQPRGTRSAGLATIALLVSCLLLGPAFGRATTFNVSGQYSSGLSGAGTFAGTLTTDGNYTTAVDITFPMVDPFTYIYNSLPSGNNWEFTAYNDDSQELDLTFSTTPTPGSLVGMTGGTIVSGQVLDIQSGGFPLFQGFSGTISPSLSSAVPEPSSLVLPALGFVALGFARKRAPNRKLQG